MKTRNTLTTLFALCLYAAPSLSPADQGASPGTLPFRDHLSNGQPCPYCPQMVILPRGRFLMGAFPWDGHDDEQGPDNRPFRIELKSPIALSILEITRQQYQAFVDATPEHQEDGDCAGLPSTPTFPGDGSPPASNNRTTIRWSACPSAPSQT